MDAGAVSQSGQAEGGRSGAVIPGLRLKLIDVAVEIADARAPLATRNPDLDVLLAGKARILLLNKSDLADDAATRGWLAYYERTGIPAGRIVSTGSGRTEAARLIEQAAKELVERQKNKGVRKTVRALVCGIPNVGKSTFINRIAGEARTKTADRPGVTKGRQWVRVTPYLELLDTPGLLWPKLEDQIDPFTHAVRRDQDPARSPFNSQRLGLSRIEHIAFLVPVFFRNGLPGSAVGERDDRRTSEEVQLRHR